MTAGTPPPGAAALPQLRQRTETDARVLLVARLLSLATAELDAELDRAVDGNLALERLQRCPGCGARSTSSPCASCRTTSGALVAVMAAPNDERAQLAQLAAMGAARATRPAIEAVVGVLDAHGVLFGSSTAQLAAETGHSIEAVATALVAIRAVGPPGIASFGPQECLLAQLAALDLGDALVATRLRLLISDCFEDLAAHRWAAIGRHLAMAPDDVPALVAVLRTHLQPFPDIDLGAAAPVRAPDLELRWGSDGVRAHLVEDDRCGLRIADDYRSLLTHPGLSTEAQEQLQTDLRRARGLLVALDRRASTLRTVVAHIATVHAEHLHLPDLPFPRLTRRDVATAIGLHESTVSRAVANRTVRLIDGRVVPIARLVGEGHDVRGALASLLASGHGDAPDQVLVRELAVRGFTVARRTVAKYRAQLGAAPRRRSVRHGSTAGH